VGEIERALENREVIAVCGAGAAGMAAAVAAARAGADVCLIEAEPRIGGTVAHALIHTLGGLYDSEGAFLNGGLAEELAEGLLRTDPAVRRRRLGRTWVLSADPETYQGVAWRMLAAEPRVTAKTKARVCGVERSADRIVGLDVAGPSGPFRLRTRAVVDATGVGAIARLADTGLVQDDGRRAAGGLIFSLRGVAPGTLDWPKGLAIVRALRTAASEGILPSECARTWVDIGVREDEVYVKLAVALPNDWLDEEARGEITRAARQTQAAVVAFLRGLPGFGAAQVSRTGNLGIRDGGRVRGEYCLTADDVRQGRRFADAACRCAWPIEYWDPEHGVALEYLPDGRSYDIPMRSLKVKGIANLWVAGKCLAADHLAQASARVAGCCWSMGEAAGRAAAVRACWR
jgi:FAD dependent oxidoreductase